MNLMPSSNATLTEKVSVKNLNFYYGQSLALKNINLPLYEQLVTAFIGPSGCGKSTLLRVLNRMYDLYPNQRAEGEVMFDGVNLLSPKQDVNLLRSRIGMVFQKPTPFPMTIYENIAFGVRLYERLSKSDLDESRRAILAQGRPVERGQRQAQLQRAQPFGWSAAASLHCAHRRHQA